MFITMVLVIGPVSVFLGVVAAQLLPVGLRTAVIVITTLWAVASVTCLVRTACMDPGVIPRRPHTLPPHCSAGNCRVYEVYVNGGKAAQVRYNDTTRFFQPPRAHHCSINDNCYDKFDHHCPWTGTTIAVRNYRTFLLFTFLTLGLVIWTIVWSIIQIVQVTDAAKAAGGSGNFPDPAPLQSAAAIALLIYCFPALFFLLPLSGFHAWLVSHNRSTYENYKYTGNNEHPYDFGSCAKNWGAVCCSRTPASRVDFSAPTHQLYSLHWWQPGDEWSQQKLRLDPESENESARQSFEDSRDDIEMVSPTMVSGVCPPENKQVGGFGLLSWGGHRQEERIQR